MNEVKKDKLVIVIPAYNEEENIEFVIKQWNAVAEGCGEESVLLVLNDGSRDFTLSRALACKPHNSRLEVIDKPNSGHGQTCMYGYKKALEMGADYIFQTDSDGQTSPDDFGVFWARRHGDDFIFGLRRRRGDGWARFVISKILRLVIRAATGVYVEDSNVPFRLMKAEKLAKYLAEIPSRFYLANALLPVVLLSGGEKIAWEPITFDDRRGGSPSVSALKFIKVGFMVWREFLSFAISRRGGRNA